MQQLIESRKSFDFILQQSMIVEFLRFIFVSIRQIILIGGYEYTI